ncbi:MAG: pyridoxal phosphate-dependent aminotransferase [Acetobacteraceae bacterium]
MDLIRPAITRLEDSPIVEVWRMGRNRPDVIGLWAGESDLPTPDFICQAAAKALAAGRTFYTDNRGIPALRQALADYYRAHWNVDVADERIAVTSSGMNAVALITQSILAPGDNLVAVTPSWPNILRSAEIAGAEVRAVPLVSTQGGWMLDLDAVLAACDARTRLIYYASPGNPTGWIMERAEMERLLDFARARAVAVVADEVYQRLVYDRTVAPSLLEVARPDDPAYVVNSFSKSWAMTGWRLGWIVYPTGQAPIFEKMVQFNTSGAQAFLQEGAVAALRDGEDFVRRFVARCRAGWQQIGDGLRRMPRVRLVPNSASFYVMFSIEGVCDTLQFCKRAVEEAGVGLAPGMAFGGGADSHIRLCYARAPEQLEMALTRLAPFIADYAEA